MQEIVLKFTLEQLEEAAKDFFKTTADLRKFAFYGEMGAGKTTFITALCRELGTDDLVSSPTFAIVNEYAEPDGTPIFHFDFYRIKEESELMDIGFFEYCDQEGYCFIEWPGKAEAILPEDFVAVRLQVDNTGLRTLSLSI